MKKIIFFLIFALFSTNVLSATLSLTSIGNLQTEGKVYSEWWYTGENPMFEGKAAPSTDVVITINTANDTVKSDSSGTWTFQTSALTKGDHNIVISSGSEKLSFLLHAGQGLPDTIPSSTAPGAGIAVPDTAGPGFINIVMSAILISFGVYFYLSSKISADRVLKSLVSEDN